MPHGVFRSHIKLTPAEKNIASWALDVMPEFFEEIGKPETVLPKIQGDYLIVGDELAMQDLIYRIVVQLGDMVDQVFGSERQQALKDKRAGISLFRKIYITTGIDTAFFTEFRDFLDSVQIKKLLKQN